MENAMPKIGTQSISLPTLMTVEQVAGHTGFCSRQIRRWIASGELPAIRFGRSLRVAENDLALFITTQKHS
jgi:excisionase family DNA binding protein